MSHVLPTQNLLRERYFYDFEEGTLTPKNPARRASGKAPGKICVLIGGRQYYMHRLVWIYFNGEIPEGWLVVYADGDTTNNHIQNLKLQPHSVVAHTSIRSNRTGYRGVTRCDPKADRYRAVIKKEGREFHLGCFGTPWEAARAYNKKARELYGAEAVLNEGV